MHREAAPSGTHPYDCADSDGEDEARNGDFSSNASIIVDPSATFIDQPECDVLNRLVRKRIHIFKIVI